MLIYLELVAPIDIIYLCAAVCPFGRTDGRVDERTKEPELSKQVI